MSAYFCQKLAGQAGQRSEENIETTAILSSMASSSTRFGDCGLGGRFESQQADDG